MLIAAVGCERNHDTPADDAAFESKIENAWGMVRNYQNLVQAGKAADIEDPQIAFAAEFFEYYLKHQETRVGKQALSSAFAMWGNTGQIDEVQQAVKKISVDSEVWPQILGGIEKAYILSGLFPDLITLCNQLAERLTHPYSQTALFNRLGYYYFQLGENTQARTFFDKVVKLNAVPFYVETAGGFMYEIDSLNVGQTAPNFSAVDITGKELSLSDYRGKVVLLDFWATWCAPCMPLVPHLKRVYADYNSQDFRIIGISLDTEITALTGFIQAKEMPWPQIFQPEKWQARLVELYNIRELPSAYLINRDGTIAAKHLTMETLGPTIERLLEAPEISSR